MVDNNNNKLIQESLCSGWERLVANILLNRTRGDTVMGVLETLLIRWPSPESLSKAHAGEVASVIRGCGLQNVKARRLILMSGDYLSNGWERPEDLPGIGGYGGDSWRIFDGPVEGKDSVNPTDKALVGYLSRVGKGVRCDI